MVRCGACGADGGGCDRPVRVFSAGGSFMVWSVDGAMHLRRKHRIVGACVGSYPPHTQQNEFCSLPLVLMDEEVALGLHLGFLEVVDDGQPRAAADARKDAWHSTRQHDFQQQHARFQLHRQRQRELFSTRKRKWEGKEEGDGRAQPGGGQGANGEQKEQGQREERGPGRREEGDLVQSGKQASQKGFGNTPLFVSVPTMARFVPRPIAHSLSNQSRPRKRPPVLGQPASEAAPQHHGWWAAHTTGAQPEQPDVPGWCTPQPDARPTPPDPSESPTQLALRFPLPNLPSPSGGEGNPGERYDCLIAALRAFSQRPRNSAVPLAEPPECDCKPLQPEPEVEGRVAEGDHGASQGAWEHRATVADVEVDARRFAVLWDLWRRGLFVTTGTKFGVDFLAYPGDPSRFHAHYCVSIVADQNALLRPSDIAARGRLGGAVKKSSILACVRGAAADRVSLGTLQGDLCAQCQGGVRVEYLTMDWGWI